MPALASRPELDEGQLELYESFLVLSRGRPRGFAPSGIPMIDLEAYARLHAIEDLEKFVRVMHVLDAAYLSKVQQDIENQSHQ